MFTRWTSGTLAVICLVARPAAQEPGAAKPLDESSYAIYAALLPEQWPVKDAKARSLVLREETTTYSQCEPSGPPVQGEWRDVLEAYRRENAQPRKVLAGRDLGLPYVVLALADFKTIMTWNPADPSVLGWNLFYRRYPDSGGYINVSAVGFDESRRRALVYMGHWCNNLCGSGTYYLLERTNDKWRQVRPDGLRNCAWAS